MPTQKKIEFVEQLNRDGLAMMKAALSEIDLEKAKPSSDVEKDLKPMIDMMLGFEALTRIAKGHLQQWMWKCISEHL